jgi:hypothetical protein
VRNEKKKQQPWEAGHGEAAHGGHGGLLRQKRCVRRFPLARGKRAKEERDGEAELQTSRIGQGQSNRG